MTSVTSQTSTDKIIADLEAWSRMGFAAGYFRIEKDINSAAYPSERLRRLHLENERKNRTSFETYEDAEKRHDHVQDIVAELSKREATLTQKFEKSKRRGTDAFFATIVIFFLFAIGAIYLTEDQKAGIDTATHILMALPIMYIPTYLVAKFRAKKLHSKAHQLTDLSWVLPWMKSK